MKRILLLNAECVQAVCLSKSLRKSGNYVIGFCNSKLSSGYTTRWFNKRFISPDIIKESGKFKNYLLSFLDSNPVDVIIPLADDSAEFLSKNKYEIEAKGIICAIMPFEIFNIANDKQKLMALCEKYNISHPKTRELTLDNIDAVSKYVGFPAMIKPNLSQGAKGIVKVNNKEELVYIYPEIFAQFGACTLQQYVEQPDHYYNVMLYRDKKGNIAGHTIIKIRRYFPLKGGSSCYCETIMHEALLNECKNILEKLNWIGFADFDVLEDKNTGELKIIEINPRVPSSLQASFAAGIDFGKVYLADLFDQQMPKFDYKTNRQVRWFGLDVMWFLFSHNRFKFKPSWFNFFGRNVSYHDGAWNDPLPMIAGIFAGIVKYLNPEFRKSKLKG